MVPYRPPPGRKYSRLSAWCLIVERLGMGFCTRYGSRIKETPTLYELAPQPGRNVNVARYSLNFVRSAAIKRSSNPFSCHLRHVIRRHSRLFCDSAAKNLLRHRRLSRVASGLWYSSTLRHMIFIRTCELYFDRKESWKKAVPDFHSRLRWKIRKYSTSSLLSL